MTTAARKRIRAFVLSIVFVALHASAADRQKIRALNVSLHPLLTLASAALQGNLRNRQDIVRCLGTGALAGFAFFEGKQLAGNGHVRTGLAVANVAASVTRNVAAGRSSMARIGMTIGPTRLEVSTPFDRNPSSRLHLQVSLSDAVAMGMMRSRSDRMQWRDGLISFLKSRRYEADHRQFSGYTIGVFPGTTFHATPTTWHHETIHVIEAIQADSIEPPYCAWLRRCSDQKSADFRLIRLEPVQLGVIPALGGGALSLQDYTKRWTEIEATRLA